MLFWYQVRSIKYIACISVWGIFIFTFLGLGRGETASGLVTELVNNAGSMCQIIESSNKSQWLETKKSISLACSTILTRLTIEI